VKDFDIIRAERVNPDRSFRIGGEEFTFAAVVSASVAASYEDIVTDPKRSSSEALEAMDDFVLSMIPPEQHPKWKAIRNRTGDDALSTDDIVEVLRHITEVTSGRPTVQSGDSSGQQSKPGTASKVASSTQGEGA